MIYVSGHLGNYTDCPGEAAPSQLASALRGQSAHFAACVDGEFCEPIVNCTPAYFSLRLENTGNSTLEEIRVARIELIGADGRKRGDLEVSNVRIRLMEGGPLVAGRLDAG